MGEVIALPYVRGDYSASLLQEYVDCHRKTFWRRRGFVPEETPSQKLGTRMHKDLEKWIKTGERPADPRVCEALRHFARGSDSVHSERNFERTVLGRRFTGQIDFIDARNTVLTILDLKSTSDVNRYAKTSYQLDKNLQLNVYGFNALDIFYRGAQEVVLGQVYIQTRGAMKSSKVETDPIPRADIEKRWSGYLEIIQEMEQQRGVTDVSQVEPNWNACNDYGGCPHKARCNAAEMARAGGSAHPVSEPENDLEQKLRASIFACARREVDLEMINPPDTTRRGLGAPAATPNTIAHDDLPEVFKKALKRGETLMNPLEKLAAMASGKPMQVETGPMTKAGALLDRAKQQAAPPPDEYEDEQAEEFPEREHHDPEPPPSSPTVDRACIPDVPPPAGFEWVLKDGQVLCKPIERAAAPATRTKMEAVEQPAEAPAAPKRSRGRPKKEAPEASIDITEGLKDIEKYYKGEVQLKTAELPMKTMVLLVDAHVLCGESLGRGVLLGQWLESVFESVEKSTGVPWHGHDFNKAHLVLNQHAKQKQLPSMLVCRSGSPEFRSLQEYLISQAGIIIQGSS